MEGLFNIPGQKHNRYHIHKTGEKPVGTELTLTRQPPVMPDLDLTNPITLPMRQYRDIAVELAI